MGLGAALRFTNLDLKPASSIEIATIGYSLGHGFSQIPLDHLLSMETLLAPLRFDQAIGYGEVFARLRLESTHPPLYFWLTHWWISLWIENNEIASLQVVRSLSVIFGVLTIPAMYSLAWISLRSLLTAHVAALLMAISPYGIYLAQEARHYTLSILWVILSLTCLIKSLQILQQKRSIPMWLGIGWILINGLGVATHYFYVLALVSMAISIAIFYLVQGHQIGLKYWKNLALVILGTFASALVWLPLVTEISSNELTSWIETSYKLKDLLLPLLRLGGWMITMIMLLPMESVPTIIVFVSGLTMLALVIWVVPKLIQGGRSQKFNLIVHSSRLVFSVYLTSAIAFFLLMIYGFGKDISLAARYHFVYFPILILLIVLSLANYWQSSPQQGKRMAVIFIVMGLIGSFTVINNYGFQKSRYSNRLATFIQSTSRHPAIVAMRYNTSSEIRELTSIAFAFNQLSQEHNNYQPPQFLLNRLIVNGQDMGLFNIDRALDNQSRPLDFWAINLAVGETGMKQIQCFKNEEVILATVQSGYRDRLYRCEKRK